jgi:hypothetical protein
MRYAALSHLTYWRRQIDALETVGNAGLNWASLLPYVSFQLCLDVRRRFLTLYQMLKAENGVPSNGALTWNAACHGTGGPISVQYDSGV